MNSRIEEDDHSFPWEEANMARDSYLALERENPELLRSHRKPEKGASRMLG